MLSYDYNMSDLHLKGKKFKTNPHYIINNHMFISKHDLIYIKQKFNDNNDLLAFLKNKYIEH